MKVLLATLMSHKHIAGDIEKGIKLYKKGFVKSVEQIERASKKRSKNDDDTVSRASCEDGDYFAVVTQFDGEKQNVIFRLSRDGCNLQSFKCACMWRYKADAPLCRHVVAAVLAAQGSVMDSPLVLGKCGIAKCIVHLKNTADFAKSGDMQVFSTPHMIALMEQAACDCLKSCLEDGETSVGVHVDIQHVAASRPGTEITATAKVEKVFGKKVEFAVEAYEVKNLTEKKQIGVGTHTRAIVDRAAFLKRVK